MIRRSPPASSGSGAWTSIVRKYGRGTLLRAIARIFDETESKCRNLVAKLADGVYKPKPSSTTTASRPTSACRIHRK